MSGERTYLHVHEEQHALSPPAGAPRGRPRRPRSPRPGPAGRGDAPVRDAGRLGERGRPTSRRKFEASTGRRAVLGAARRRTRWSPSVPQRALVLAAHDDRHRVRAAQREDVAGLGEPRAGRLHAHLADRALLDRAAHRVERRAALVARERDVPAPRLEARAAAPVLERDRLLDGGHAQCDRARHRPRRACLERPAAVGVRVESRPAARRPGRRATAATSVDRGRGRPSP